MMRMTRTARSVATTALLLAVVPGARGVLAEERAAISGSWVATKFEVAAPGVGPVDFVGLGGSIWMTIDTSGRYIFTVSPPGAPGLETSGGEWRADSETSFEIRPDGSDTTFALSVVITGDTALLAGPIEIDLDADGVDEIGTFEALLTRDVDKLDEGDGVPGGWVRSGGRIRTYELKRPTAADGASALLIVLHGSGDSGRSIRNFADLDRFADANGLLIAYPDAVSGEWADGCACTSANSPADDLAFVETLIGQLSSAYAVDPSRVYAAGFSRGGMFAQRLGCQLSHRIAAIASVAAGMPTSFAPACRPSRAVPVLLFHGSADRSFEGSQAFLGARDTFGKWAELGACVGPSLELLPDVAADGTSVSRTTHATCAAEVEVDLFTIDQGGHTWPGSPAAWPASFGLVTQDVSAAELIASFFDRHALR